MMKLIKLMKLMKMKMIKMKMMKMMKLMKVMIVKEVMKGDVSPVAMFFTYAHMGIWAYAKKYGQMGYPRKENQKCSSEMLTRGP